MSRPLTRQQLLGWRENWSYTDRELIEHALDVLGEADYYEPNSKTYVGARVAGRVAMYVAPGYIYWTAPKWTERLSPQMVPDGIGGGDEHKGRWYHLSTFSGPRPDSRPHPNFEELKAPCPVCFLVPAVSGACGCD